MVALLVQIAFTGSCVWFYNWADTSEGRLVLGTLSPVMYHQDKISKQLDDAHCNCRVPGKSFPLRPPDRP
jgi:hypothetical protein